MKSLAIGGLSILLLVLFFQCCPSGAVEGPSLTPEAEEIPTEPTVATPAPVHTKEPAPTETPVPPPPAPTQEPTSGVGTLDDLAYLECMMETSEEMSDFMSETADVFTSYSGRMDAFCGVWAAYDFAARLSDRRHKLFEECPMPQAECLLRSRGLTQQAFDALASAYGKIDAWCVNQDMLDATLLTEATDEFMEVNAYLVRASEEIETCPWAE